MAPETTPLTRRRLVGRLATAAAIPATLAGCADVGANLSGATPEPAVRSAEHDGQLLGPSTFQIVVENTGDAGQVTVTVTVYDEDDTVVAKRSKTVTMDAGERRRVTVEMDVPADAERFEAKAVPA